MAYIHKKLYFWANNFAPVCLFGPVCLFILTKFPTSTLIWSSTFIRNFRVQTTCIIWSKVGVLWHLKKHPKGPSWLWTYASILEQIRLFKNVIQVAVGPRPSRNRTWASCMPYLVLEFECNQHQFVILNHLYQNWWIIPF